MSEIVNVLRAEYGEIAADIRANPDPRAVKLERIAALLASYGASIPTSAPSAGRPVASEKASQATQQAPEREKAPTKRERVRGETKALAQERGIIHRVAILDRLVERGVMGHEKDPMASLAAYLSEMRDEFDHDSKGNWWLKSAPPTSANGAYHHEGELPLAASGAD